MEILDNAYLNDLVQKAQRGSSNAFAELFAATCQRQYACSCRYLQDEDLARTALRESYVRALKNIGRLQNPDLFIAWLNRINYRVCYEMRKKGDRENGMEAARDLPSPAAVRSREGNAERADHRKREGVPGREGSAGQEEGPEEEVLEVDHRKYLLRQVMNLPLMESQAFLMRYDQKMTLDEIGAAMNIRPGTVRRCLRAGKKHLQKMQF